MQLKRNQLLYLSQAEVIDVGLTMAEIIESMEIMFRAKGEGHTEMPPKPGIHPGGGDSFLHAMPACIPDLKSAGIKWVSAFPGNPARGLPYISGLVIYNDFETGLPLAVMDCVWITAKRTGAASAISARHLARPESSVMGMLGCGVQGRSNLEALACVFDTGNEFEASPYADEGKTCPACHMPEVERPLMAGFPPRMTRRHWFGGSLSNREFATYPSSRPSM